MASVWRRLERFVHANGSDASKWPFIEFAQLIFSIKHYLPLPVPLGHYLCPIKGLIASQRVIYVRTKKIKWRQNGLTLFVLVTLYRMNNSFLLRNEQKQRPVYTTFKQRERGFCLMAYYAHGVMISH